MRTAVLVVTAIVCGAWFAVSRAPVQAQDGGGAWTPQRVAKAWNHTCVKCHTVPDTEFATDLAWLDQINRTS